MIQIGSEKWKLLLSYMHLEELEDDSTDAALVQRFHAAAVSYLANAGITEDALATSGSDTADDDLALYDLTLQAMTLDMHDNRGKSAEAAATGVRSWINQLKATCISEGFL